MKRKFLAFFTLMMIIVLAMAFIACTDYNNTEPEQEDETTAVSYNQIVKNGTFYNATATDTNYKQIYDSVTSWTISPAGLATPSKGSDSEKGVFAGVLDLNETMIDTLLQDTYQIGHEEVTSTNQTPSPLETPIVFTKPSVDPATPLTDKRDDNGKVITGEGAEKVQQDSKALLFISSITSGSIYAKSASITLEADSVYKLQFSVNSKVENADSGAFVFIRGAMEKEYKLNTNNEWQTKTLYIETNKKNSMDITIELWLGYGPVKSTVTESQNDGKDKYATRGFAMFDNVILTKLVKDVTKDETEAQFDNYDKNLSLHENFLAMTTKEGEEKYSAYYLVNSDLSVRTHITDQDYFGTDKSKRKYFYEFRDYYSSNLSSSYWENSISASASYYGIVDPTLLYYKDDNNAWVLNYSQDAMKDSFMSGDVWNNTVMTDEYKARIASEPYALMFYNKDLSANSTKSKSTNNSLVIDSNKYYKISVWAYVWETVLDSANSYNGEAGQILPKYSGTEPKPVDPTGDSSTKSFTEKIVYAMYKTYLEGYPTSVLAKEGVKYFDDLTAAETTSIADFNLSTVTDELKKTMPDSTTTYYDDVLTAVQNWLVNIGVTLSTNSEDNKALAQSFIGTYLYYCYMGDADIVATIPETYNQDSLKAKFNFEEALLQKACLKERSANIALKEDMVSAYKTYEETKASLADYEKDKATYIAECEAWLNANNNHPRATLRLSGAGKNIDTRTTCTGAWEELVLYVRGNQLSSRAVSVELIFGESDENVNKMIGGVLFDNVSIIELTDAAEIANIPADELRVLSEITGLEEVSFGGLVVPENAEKPDATLLGWEKVLAGDDVAPIDIDSVSVTVEADADALQQIEIGDGTKYDSYELVYKHDVATASILKYGENAASVLATIKPNKYYRFAFQIKTEDIDGVNITLMKKTGDEEFSSFDSSVTEYKSEDWTEVVYYIQGAKNDVYYLGLQVGMGSGTRYDISSYAKGTVYLASFNCLEITSSEYGAASTGDRKQEGLTLESASSSIDSASLKVTNASYNKVDYTKTTYDDFDEDSGKIKNDAVVAVESWTKGTVFSNNLATPELNKDAANNNKLTWKKVSADVSTDTSVSAQKYEIWAKYTDAKKNDREVLLAIVEDDSENLSYDLSGLGCANWCITSVYVKAVGNGYVSDASSALTFGTKGGTQYPVAGANLKATTLKTGAIKTTDTLIAGCREVANASEYPYDYIYTIASDYYAATSVSSATMSSLSANSFYKVTVWVKTVGDNAFAGLVLEGSNGSLEAKLTEDEVVGYDKIVTNGAWKEYSFYIKTGNFSISPKVNFCFGNPNAQGKKVQETGTKLYYEQTDLAVGAAYFDSVHITQIKEEEYELAVEREGEAAAGEYAKLNNATDKLVYKNSDSFVYTLHYTVDSFDSWSNNTEDTLITTSNTDQYGYKANNYTRSVGTNNASNSDTSTNLVYGIYNAYGTDPNMVKALTYLYGNDKEKAFNSIFDFAKDFTDEDWSNYLKKFLSLTADNGKSGGNNVLVLSNKQATGTAQSYGLDSGYQYTFASGGYYKLTFTANSLLARPVFTKVETMPEADKTNWATAKSKYYYLASTGLFAATTDDAYKADNTYYTLTYSFEDAYAEFRFNSNDTNANAADSTVEIDTTAKIYISSYDKDADSIGSLKNKTYTLYIYNPAKANATGASWSFYLGDTLQKNDDKVYDKTMIGMLAIDLISVETIDEAAYTAGIGKIDDEKGCSVAKYVYAKETTSDDTGTTDNEDKNDKEEDKKDFWTNLVNDQYFWLYISSFVLGIVIIVVVIVVIVRRFREKHPRKVKGVNNVNTEKDAQQQLKEEEELEGEEELVSDEFTDDLDAPIKPVVKQRVVQKKNKKKKK